LNVFNFVLDKLPALNNYLNMFRQEIARGKSKETRASILTNAVRLFREQGFDTTTMRDVAEAADVALGAAYYYFPSKEAIVQAYYEEIQTEHSRRVTEALAATKHSLEERLRIAFNTKFDVLAHDRKLLGALFRYTAEPGHPLSVFNSASRPVRDQSMNVFAVAIADEKLPEDIRAILPMALWAAHLGILLYFIYDESAGQKRTRKLIDGVIRLVVRVLGVARLSIMKPLRGSLFSLLREAELFPMLNIHAASMREER
jgi:AcrR family transcriptional regulator